MRLFSWNLFSWIKALHPIRGAHRRLGSKGEKLAAQHLRRRGYKILARNLRSRHGEMDLVALSPDGCVVIVEVKAGRAPEGFRQFGGFRPEMHVTKAKQRKLVALAADFARRHDLTRKPFRFDVVAVEFDARGKATLRHHAGAFLSPV